MFKKILLLLSIVLTLLFSFNFSVSAALFDPSGEGTHFLDIFGFWTFNQPASGPPDVTLTQVIYTIINVILSFLAVLFIGLIIYGGYLWMFSGGDSGKVENARKTIVNASLGLIIILLAGGINKMILDIFEKEDYDSHLLTDVSVMDVVIRIINIALSFFGVFFILMLIYGGYRWMFSGGDSNKVDSARKIIIHAVIGAVVVLFSFTLLKIITGLVG